MSDDEDDTRILEFPSERTEDAITFGDAFATVKGPRTAFSAEFIWRDGRSFAMPYQLLPIPWWKPPATLLIEYPGFFTVSLSGRRLGELHRRFRDRKVLWVRECEKDSAAPLVVTSIAILQSFPSREAIGDGFG